MQLTHQEDCFSNMRQDFLVCTTVHKARHLGTFHGQTLVRVTFGKTQKHTRSFLNSENPYFNEYFVFELNCTLNELLRQTILFEVLKRGGLCSSNVELGELRIDLHTVWLQPHRYFYKKWGRLDLPLNNRTKNVDAQPRGFLQIDLAIVTSSSNTDLFKEVIPSNVYDWELNHDYDDIKKNLLTNVDSSVECNIRYTISFYSGYFVKKSDYQIQFIFHPFKGKTDIQKGTSNPHFNEYITFTWTFPSLAETFLLQLFANGKCIADYELHFNEIAFKDKPKLGPTFLHFYDSVNPSNYIGRLMIEIRSECLTEKIPPRELVSGTVTPADEKRWWQDEIFTIEFLVLSGDFLHGNLSNYKITMKLGEHVSNFIECFTKSYDSNLKAFSRLKYFKEEAPYKAINITADLPDNRHKYDSDYFLQEIIDFMKSELEAFKLFQLKYTNRFQMQNKCLKSIIQTLQSKIKEGVSKKRFEYTNYRDPTPWDTNRLVYLQDLMRIIPERLRDMVQRLKNTDVYSIEHTMDDVVQQLTNQYKELSDITYLTRVQDDWPELFLVLSSSNKDIALCRINPKIYLNAPMDKEISPSNVCWHVRHFIFKDINCRHLCNNCGCINAVIQGCIGIIAESEHSVFLDEIYDEWKQVENFCYTPIVPFTTFKCRIFVYQAKVRPGHDKTGLCDAFARVLFNGVQAETHSHQATLSPTWNVVISFECLRLPGSIEWYQAHSPVIAVELYDLDKHTADDYLGCGILSSVVISKQLADKNHHGDEWGSYLRKYQQLKNLSPPPLKWIPIARNGTIRAELLISAEFVEIEDCQDLTNEPSITLGIPMIIRPNVKNFVFEVVFAGFRNYIKSFSGRHRVKVMMGDLLLTSGLTTSKLKNSVNFLVLYASGVVSLPEQLEYWPAIIVTEVVATTKGDGPTVGAMILPNSKRYLQREKFIMCMAMDTEIETPHTTVFVEGMEKALMPFNDQKQSWATTCFKSLCQRSAKKKCLATTPLDDSNFNWWTKFYNSLHEKTLDFDHCKHSLTIFHKELERFPEYSYFYDWAEPIVLVHGIKFKKNTVPKEETYATLKLHIKITPCQCDLDDCGDGATLKPLATALNPQYQAQVQTLAELRKIIVRIYVVQGLNFRPRDRNTESDSYVKVRLGPKVQSNRAHYIPNQSNPIFGRCFQLEGVLPREHLLEISVYDRDNVIDDIIGSTLIDLEDRWRTKHRATIGLANEYSKKGYNKWRDINTPLEILTDYCIKRQLNQPKFSDNQVTVDGVTFKNETEISKDEDIQEQLSLTALKNLEKLPSFRYKLVPEHVETRSLYRDNFPGIEQGKLQLWVELYDSDLNIPSPIDITPQSALDYELRVTVFNCEDITLDEVNIFGTRMSDIFVKGWCNDFQQAQSTDVHFRSLNGVGNFNWRMIFNFKYSAIENMMIIKRKTTLLEQFHTKQPPILYLHIWDNDFISENDFLAALEINLANFPQPYATSSACTAASLDFERGWLRYGEYQKIDEFHPISFSTRRSINLFNEKSIRGWFPLVGPPDENNVKHAFHSVFAGKIELELEVLTANEAAEDPAGVGRSEPHALPSPKRPDTSFNFISHPLSSFKHIIYPAIRKYGFVILAVVLSFMLVGLTLMNLPFLMMTFIP